MRNLFLATCIILLTSFCTKEVTPATCGAVWDYEYLASLGMPGYQGQCYLVTNEQIRWMQLNGWIGNLSTAPNNKECPTKAQFETYVGSSFSGSDAYTALASNRCVPIGFFYPAT